MGWKITWEKKWVSGWKKRRTGYWGHHALRRRSEVYEEWFFFARIGSQTHQPFR